MQGLRYRFGYCALAALLLLSAASLSAQSKKPISRFAGNPRRTPVVDLVRRVQGAVVNIHSERLVRDNAKEDLFAFAPSRNRVNGMGTAIVIDSRGYLVTNQHVIADVSVLRARLADGTTTRAHVIAEDVENDLALLKIDVSKPLPTMPLGTANDLMVGETVVAIGNAYGYDHTVTVGVVSAIKRDVKLNKKISYEDLIQTDASINPGNSGGPLMNVRGELIGVNVAIRAGAQGIGFAIPVDTMMKVASELIAEQRRAKIRLGMSLRDVAVNGDTEPLRRSLLVERVIADSPAAKAGLKRGDVIEGVGEETTVCRLDLECALLGKSAEETVLFRVSRNDKRQVAHLKLSKPRFDVAELPGVVWQRLGVRLQPVSKEVAGLSDHQLRGGLFVLSVQDDGVAARAGIHQGDVLVGLHKWEMTQMANVLYVLQHPDLKDFSPLQFCVIRDGQVQWGWLRPSD